MTLQGILFIAGIVLLVAAAACTGIDIWLYVKKNIRDIRDDLTGKKRAKTIAEMDEMTPTSRRRQRQGHRPASAAAEAAASVARRAAEAQDAADTQPTVAPKASNTPSQVQTSPELEEPATVVEGESGETIISVPGDAVEEETTMVAGVEALPSSGDKDETQDFGLASIQIVRKIVLAESADFVRIGRQGEINA